MNPDRIVLWILIGVVMWLVYLHFADQPTKYEPITSGYGNYDSSEQRRLNDRIDCLAARESDRSLGLHRNC